MNLIRLLRMPCVFQMMTGLYCPGCGGTRALWFLLHGDILKSLWYHPLIFYTAMLLIWWMISEMRKRCFGKNGFKLHRWMIVGGILITFVNWVWKNAVLLIWHVPLI